MSAVKLSTYEEMLRVSELNEEAAIEHAAMLETQIVELRRQLAEVTQQRDALVEALNEIVCAYKQDYSTPDNAAHSGTPIDPEAVANEALAKLGAGKTADKQ